MSICQVRNNQDPLIIPNATTTTSGVINPDEKAKLNSFPAPGTLFSEKAGANDVHVTTTSPTVVASYTPSAQGNILVHIYYRVVNASTNVALTLNYTDGSGAQVETIVNGSVPVTSTTVEDTFINAVAAPITVNATAGTANNLFVSVSIEGLN